MYSKKKVNLSFTEAITALQSTAAKSVTEFSKIRSKYNQMGDSYKKAVYETQRLTKELDDKNSQIKQIQVELSFLQDTVTAQKEKIKSLNQNESELSIYRSSANSMKSLDINNELFFNKCYEKPTTFVNEPEIGG